jgi:hypothetical protein
MKDPTPTKLARSAGLPSSVIAAVAKAKGLTVPELHARLAERALDAALDGDLEAVRFVRELSIGPALGFLDKVRTSKGLHRRILKGLRMGILTPAEAKTLASLVDQRQRLEHDDVEQRLSEIEGTVVSRG